MSRKRTHGGKRAGAGRPSKGQRGTPIYLRPTVEQRAEIERRANAVGLTITDYVLGTALSDDLAQLRSP